MQFYKALIKKLKILYLGKFINLKIKVDQNISYSEDPGFEDFNHFKFNLKKDAKIFKDLPSFKAIPFEKIGLMVDEYRKVLPTDKDLKKFNRNRQTDKKGTDILDRG